MIHFGIIESKNGLEDIVHRALVYRQLKAYTFNQVLKVA